MPAYAVAHLHNVDLNAEIVEYLERIDGTLAPLGGRFIVHGGRQLVAEGPADGNVIVIEFPDYEAAEGWYRSPGYLAILPLRARTTPPESSCWPNTAATTVPPPTCSARVPHAPES
jgi:uncharacterized protein (DUF1330 family)